MLLPGVLTWLRIVDLAWQDVCGGDPDGGMVEVIRRDVGDGEVRECGWSRLSDRMATGRHSGRQYDHQLMSLVVSPVRACHRAVGESSCVLWRFRRTTSLGRRPRRARGAGSSGSTNRVSVWRV